ncbi:hypothetical protein [Clostridium pasteurianum]|uniref:Uncharacterized protein n=1 Tax=Clostridium pasteurianum BC1 TaxID=86416 RepID=R4K2H5_CLOPA|nr:hypothetical protein [Clostridium pasteurianum]AGK96783.1 hypothetical protein Clopa_1883 [Clostridium pasteurianum BC1]
MMKQDIKEIMDIIIKHDALNINSLDVHIETKAIVIARCIKAIKKELEN